MGGGGEGGGLRRGFKAGGASQLFGTFFSLNHNKDLDFYRVPYDGKEEEEKENDDSFLETTPPST